MADELNFTRASERLHVSQPALTAHIQELESELGVQLLERNRRGVKLTPAGMVFRRDAGSILQKLIEAEKTAQQVARGEAGHLRIAFVASAAIHLVPSIVMEFRRLYPAVTLELLNLRTVEQIARLEEGRLDAGFLRLPVTSKRLEIMPIHKEPFVLVMPLGHRLAAKPGFRPEDAEGEEFLAYGRQWAPAFFDTWTAIFESCGVTPRIVQETGEMGTLLALVAAGAGIAVVPRGLVKKSGETLVMRDLPPRSPSSVIGFACRAGERTPLLTKLGALSRTMGRRASKED